MTVSLLALLFLSWFVRKRPVASLGLAFVLFTFAWRLVAAAYMDWRGPIYSYEVDRIVGVPWAADCFGAIIIVTLAVIAYVFRPDYLRNSIAGITLSPSESNARVTLGGVVFWPAFLYVCMLYGDMLYRGVIPLFDCMERYEYSEGYAGPLHRILFKYGSLIAFQLGTFCMYPRLLGRAYDWRFLGLLLLLLIYSALTGTRFSAFYSLSFFFFAPFCAVYAVKRYGQQLRSTDLTTPSWHSVAHRAFIPGLSLLVVVMAAGAIVHSYADVRATGGCKELAGLPAIDDAIGPESSITSNTMMDRFLSTDTQYRLVQRVLVQPIHLWLVTWERVVEHGQSEPSKGLAYVFDPDSARDGNRSIRYLMELALPADRAAYLKSVGNQFAGGFPEILFELLGPWLSWPAIVLAAAAMAWLFRCWIAAVVNGYFLTAFFAIYVYYALVVFYIGGMLNFLVAATFWGKVALLVFLSWYERRRCRPLLRWRIQTGGSS